MRAAFVNAASGWMRLSALHPLALLREEILERAFLERGSMDSRRRCAVRALVLRREMIHGVIASEAKQSSTQARPWIASSLRSSQ
jgi:hypothetical protein